jgi:hypothetical protein
MKSSLRTIILGAFGAVLLSLSFHATSFAVPISDITLNSEKVQVVHGSTPNTDSTSMTLDITNSGGGSCETGDDLIAGGLEEIALSNCSCEDIVWIMDGYCAPPFNDSIPYFVSHTISGHQYGTFFSSMEPGGAGSTTLSAKATTLATPMGDCGRWTLNLTATKLNLSSITTSSAMHPIALFINDGDNSGPFCFDIKDAIVGPVIVH